MVPRQCPLLNRREKYDGTGIQRLWMAAGGSAGQSVIAGLDIDEGQLQDDFSGRKWDVRVLGGDDCRPASKDDEQAKKVDEDGGAVMAALTKLDPANVGVSYTCLRNETGWGSTRLDKALHKMREFLAECSINCRKNKGGTGKAKGY